MKNTPFTDIHIALGAKMAEFAGYNMPISYSGINNEHAAVRQSVGVFDVSHMGEFILKGPNALDLIQRVTSNDAAKLSNGKAQYSCLPNGKGGIVDDLLVYCVEANQVYMLVVNASNIDKDWNWIQQHNTNNVEMHNISNKTGLLAVQGPMAMKAMQKLTDMDLINLSYYTFVKGKFAGIDNVLVSATGYTGAGGVEIYYEDDGKNGEALWNKIMEAGAEYNIQPCGLGCRDTLRLEMGFCLYGNDIDDTTNPIEAGLGWITKFTKDFTDRAFLETQKKEGTSRKLLGFEMVDKGIPRHHYKIKDANGIFGFEMVDKGIPRHHYKIKDANGTEIGHVTSGTQSPSLGKAIGLGYVNTAHAAIGTDIYIDIRDKLIKATVVKLPFYQG